MTRKGYAKDNEMNRFEADAADGDDAQDRVAQGRFAGEDPGTAGRDAEEAGSEISDTEFLNAEIERLRKQAEADRDQLLRVSAEFENYKKRTQRHMEDFKKYANEALLKELLTVVDNLERAVSSSGGIPADSPDACIVEGVEMTLKEILRVLEKFNVTPVDALGKPFDPVFHEAVMREESSVYPANTVCNVLQKGYMIHDRLLRPAMVSVVCG